MLQKIVRRFPFIVAKNSKIKMTTLPSPDWPDINLPALLDEKDLYKG
jgi:hypothetical protein